ncbi:MAG: bifunctional folylpolyglutamate synthase/dihydrofolate synthase [Dehalococcoidales bacterium]|nr:bifunctional folylpolyglutamate synthase/dihydrofolate synthase [Dehalococcoidales bacterium]
MNYQESIAYLLRFADYERLPRSGIVWDLRRVERLLERLGAPQYHARTVHVAGTKGKGSTSAMMASILAHAGFKVGLYTSPHLLSYTERIRVNGIPVSEAEWVQLTEAIRPHVEAENRRGDLGQLTTFEIFTAMAFLHFRNIGADWQVIEVGLGGRLDATNVVRPEVCIITSISYDHMDVLGDTLDKIAREKSGIIKGGADVVSAPQSPEALGVIEEVCRQKQVRLIKVGSDVTWRAIRSDISGQDFRVHGLKGSYDIMLPLLGDYQMENAACAVAAAELLMERGVSLGAGDISGGLASVSWAGRFQILRRSPWLIVDGAHNADSMKRLGEALHQYFPHHKLTLVLGFGNDKDVSGMVAEAVKITGSIVLAPSRHPKAVKPDAIAQEFAKYGVCPRTAGTVAGAVQLAIKDAGPDDVVCAAGSLFVTAEVMEMMAS